MSRRNSVQSLPMIEIDTSKLGEFPFVVYPEEGLPFSCFCMRYINKSDHDVAISYDNGVTKHDIVLANQTVQLNFGDNIMEALMGSVGMLCGGTKLTVMLHEKGPAKGSFYIVGYYFMPGR